MVDGSPNDHVADTDWISYLEERLPPTQARLVDEHIAVCAVCAERARHAVRRAAAMQAWTAAAHGDAHVRSRAEAAIRGAQDDPRWTNARQRLLRWCDDLRLAPTVRVVVASGDAPTDFATFSPSQDVDNAAPLLPFVVGSPEHGGLRIETAAGAQHIAIDANVWRPGPPPLVLLVPERGSAIPRLIETLRQGTDRFIASLREIPAGAYLVVVEPRAAMA